MQLVPRILRDMLRRWTRDAYAAAYKLSAGKTAGRRVEGFSESERIDARFLLLAGAPGCALLALHEFGPGRGFLWDVAFWLSIGWMIVITGVLLIVYIRASVRSMDRWRRTHGRKD